MGTAVIVGRAGSWSGEGVGGRGPNIKGEGSGETERLSGIRRLVRLLLLQHDVEVTIVKWSAYLGLEDRAV